MYVYARSYEKERERETERERQRERESESARERETGGERGGGLRRRFCFALHVTDDFSDDERHMKSTLRPYAKHPKPATLSPEEFEQAHANTLLRSRKPPSSQN